MKKYSLINFLLKIRYKKEKEKTKDFSQAKEYVGAQFPISFRKDFDIVFVSIKQRFFNAYRKSSV